MTKLLLTQTLAMQADRIAHFVRRIRERGDDPNEVLVVCINVDDNDFTNHLANQLMPDENWQAYRNRGETPFARGLCTRAPIQERLDDLIPEVGDALRALEGEIAIVVFDHGSAGVFYGNLPA